MLRAAVTIGCAAALAAAVILVVRLRRTRRTPSPLSGDEPFAERLAVTIARSGGMLAGAYVAGVLTIGAGGRLMMRVLAATSSDAAQGRLTEADEIVGAVSAGGSFFLILATGLGAALGGLLVFSVLRRWLPDRSLNAGLIGVAIGAGAVVRPSGLLDPANSDFALLDPVALAVAFSLAIVGLFGATFGVLVEDFAPRWPRPGWSPRGVVALLPFAVLLAAPPLLVLVVAVVLVGTVAPSALSSTERVRPGRRTGARAAAGAGRVLVLILGAVGGLSVLVAAAQVLAV